MPKNNKIIILIGVQRSGKTTWAHKFSEKHPSYITVSKDRFRFMLRPEIKMSNKIEKLITDLQNNVILQALEKKLNVIIDNTHLKERHIQHIIDLVDGRADISFMIFDVSLKKILERDELHGNYFGEKFLKRKYKEYLNVRDKFVQNISALTKEEQAKRYFKRKVKYIKKLPEAVIFDIDGTLAIINRFPFDFKKVDCDLPNTVVIEHLKMHKQKGRKIILMSGRNIESKDLTIEWLNFYEIPFDELYMRGNEDIRKDSIIKEELYNEYIKNKNNILVVFDDRQQVVNLWRKIGLHCFQVNHNPI